MERFYCQSDGGQWNVKVWVEDYLPPECGDNVVIHGKGLISPTVDSGGNGIMIVERCSLFDKEQPTD